METYETCWLVGLVLASIGVLMILAKHFYYGSILKFCLFLLPFVVGLLAFNKDLIQINPPQQENAGRWLVYLITVSFFLLVYWTIALIDCFAVAKKKRELQEDAAPADDNNDSNDADGSYMSSRHGWSA